MPPRKRYNRKKYHPSGKRKQPNRKVKTNKQLTRAVKGLKKMHEIKYHYVDYDNKQLNILSLPSDTSFRISSIPFGDDVEAHSGDSVTLRSLDLHGQCYVGNSGSAPTIPSTRTLTVIAVRSSDPTTGTTALNQPTASSLYRFAKEAGSATAISEENLPLTDNFRLLNTSNTSSLKILAIKSFQLDPHGPYSSVPVGETELIGTRPDRVKFKMSVPVRGLKVDFEGGTATNIGQSVWILAYCNSRGSGADTGIRLSYTTKLSFYDRD